MAMNVAYYRLYSTSLLSASSSSTILLFFFLCTTSSFSAECRVDRYISYAFWRRCIESFALVSRSDIVSDVIYALLLSI